MTVLFAQVTRRDGFDTLVENLEEAWLVIRQVIAATAWTGRSYFCRIAPMSAYHHESVGQICSQLSEKVCLSAAVHKRHAFQKDMD
jgi:hypothetical protein